MASFASLLERLDTPLPAVRRFTVDSIFQRLRSPQSNPNVHESAREALLQCLTHPAAEVADQAAQGVLGLVDTGTCTAEQGTSMGESPLELPNPTKLCC